jgi:hypothetical protein
MVISSRPPSSVPNSSNKSVKASLNSIIPWAGIAICDRGPPLDIVWETCESTKSYCYSKVSKEKRFGRFAYA